MHRFLTYIGLILGLFLGLQSPARAQATWNACAKAAVETVVVEGANYLALEAVLGVVAKFTPTPADDLLVWAGPGLIANAPRIAQAASRTMLRVYHAAKEFLEGERAVSQIIRYSDNRATRDYVFKSAGRKVWAKEGSGIVSEFGNLVSPKASDPVGNLERLLSEVAGVHGTERCILYEGVAQVAQNYRRFASALETIHLQRGGLAKVYAASNRVEGGVPMILTEGKGIWIPSGERIATSVLARKEVAGVWRKLIVTEPHPQIGTIVGWITEGNLTQITQIRLWTWIVNGQA